MSTHQTRGRWAGSLRSRRAAALWVAATLLGGCGQAEAPPGAAPPPPPAPAPSAAPAPPPAPATFPCLDGNAARGEASYATYCASCHGVGGDGPGPAAAGLNPKPARHDDGTIMNALDNDHLVKVIQLGGPAVGKSPLMAPWGGTLSEAQIRDVVAYVRTLAEPPYSCP